MTNKEFACLLAKAVEMKKLNNTKLVNEFIIVYDGNSEVSVDCRKVSSVEPETKDLVKKLISKKYKVNDSVLRDVITKIAELPSDEEEVNCFGTYYAQEY